MVVADLCPERMQLVSLMWATDDFALVVQPL
jgi:hypothetical protein